MHNENQALKLSRFYFKLAQNDNGMNVKSGLSLVKSCEIGPNMKSDLKDWSVNSPKVIKE